VGGRQIIESVIAEAVAAHKAAEVADDAWITGLQQMRAEALRIIGDMNDAERAAADTLAKLRAELERTRAELGVVNAELAKAREAYALQLEANAYEKRVILDTIDGLLAKTKVA
jgi:hypothetical protein